MKFSTKNQGLPGLPGLPSLPGLPACQNLLKMKLSTNNQGLPGLPGLPKCKKSPFGPITSLICEWHGRVVVCYVYHLNYHISMKGWEKMAHAILRDDRYFGNHHHRAV